MNALLIEDTIVISSSAPGKFFQSSVVCFQDSFYIILKVASYTFGVDDHPVSSYKFGEDVGDDVAKGVRNIVDSHNNEHELKERLLSLIHNNTACVVNFSDYKKVKLKSFLGNKTLKAMNNAMSYISFNAGKETGKRLAKFYSNL